MWSRAYQRTDAAHCTLMCRRSGVAAALTIALSAAGCTTDLTPTGSIGASPARTVAFESIDGPPVGVFHNLVATLSDEAAVRRLPVTSREAAPSYRVRAYMTVRMVKERPYVAWVWDVYDADKRRALRITGEEPATRGTNDAWTGVDRDVLRRIANRGLERLAVYLGALGSAPAGEPQSAPPDRQDASVVASVSAAAAPAAVLAATDPVPLPPRRPQSLASSAPAHNSVVLSMRAR